ncbi:TolC family outer membrane protein [Duganella qianjiadongensis]|uniref:TolC family outer membrane protein n=1 Tax=Duganella qianjiadongensis TaxID=2692176 RepID=A0ABW9VGU9_9BURK|nr:TolC family outer membrane protein [Duganella qianjiadongensis]MYM38688.1 TolC family outer membrane protein [Duganella qianjiadongensis]
MAYPLKQSTLRLALSGVLGLGSLFALPGAHAMTVLQAYEAALQNDAAYRAAYYAAEAGKENRTLGMSNLLPSINGSYSASQNRTTLEVGKDIHPYDYISRSSTVQLRQSLFNLDGWFRFKQGAAQSKYTDAQFASQQQEVIVRVMSAYLDVLYKQDLLALAKVERDMYLEQRKVNDRLFEKGEGTRTDMLETQARLDASQAQVLETEDALQFSRDTLSSIVGGEIGTLDVLMLDFAPRPADSVSFEAWKTIALERNPDIKAARLGVEIATQDINRQRSGHAPRVDFVATYGKTASDSITTVNQDQTIRSLGVQINIPLYSGGAVNAQTRQSVANKLKAEADLQAQTDKVVLELRKDYSSLLSSITRLGALEKAVASATTLIDATQRSVAGGVRINLDVLNARQQLFTVKRDQAQARYNYLLITLRMRAAVGTLSGDDLREIAPYFRPAA